MKDNYPIKEFITTRNKILNIVSFSVLLSIAVSLLVFGLTGVGDNDFIYAIIGGSLIILILTVFSIILFKNLKREFICEGFLIYNSKKQRFLSVPEYDISLQFDECLNSYIRKNKDNKKEWKCLFEKLMLLSDIEADPEEQDRVIIENKNIIRDLVEYMVLDSLSSSLTDYYHNPYLRKYKTKEIADSDIMKILNNRFQAQFSTEKVNPNQNNYSEIVFGNKIEEKLFMAKDGFGNMYRRTDLILPKASKMLKTEYGFVIKTRMFDLYFEFYFDGNPSHLDSEFIEYYLNEKTNYFDNMVFEIVVCSSVRYKPWALFSISRWDNYKWLDVFLKEMQAIDKKIFLDKINWNTLKTQIWAMTHVIK